MLYKVGAGQTVDGARSTIDVCVRSATGVQKEVHVRRTEAVSEFIDVLAGVHTGIT
jgi:hypothetical protein